MEQLGINKRNYNNYFLTRRYAVHLEFRPSSMGHNPTLQSYLS